MNLPEGFHQEVIGARENARKKVSTYLLNRGGPSFDTHSLHRTRNNNLCFKLSPRLGFETVILFGIPLACLGLFIYMYIKTGSFVFLLDRAIFYIIFAYISSTMLASFFGNLRCYTFSKNSNFYYVGFPLFPVQLSFTKISLVDILAIQVLGETLTEENSKAKRNSFELNLVLKDLKRIHVIDHNNLQGMLDDAQLLSNYLKVPIWHPKSSNDSTSIDWGN